MKAVTMDTRVETFANGEELIVYWVRIGLDPPSDDHEDYMYRCVLDITSSTGDDCMVDRAEIIGIRRVASGAEHRVKGVPADKPYRDAGDYTKVYCTVLLLASGHREIIGGTKDGTSDEFHDAIVNAWRDAGRYDDEKEEATG